MVSFMASLMSISLACPRIWTIQPIGANVKSQLTRSTMDPGSYNFRGSSSSVNDDTWCVEQAGGNLSGGSNHPGGKILDGLTSKAN